VSGHLTSLIKPVGHEEHYHTSQDESHKDQCRCRIHADSLTGIQGGGYPCPCACPETLFPAPAQVSDFATPGLRSWSCQKSHMIMGNARLDGSSCGSWSLILSISRQLLRELVLLILLRADEPFVCTMCAPRLGGGRHAACTHPHQLRPPSLAYSRPIG
jgi:hypothetical protein